jgi:hypothetical protein
MVLFFVIVLLNNQKFTDMLSKNQYQYAKSLASRDHRDPMIKAMIIIFDILSDFEEGKDGSDPNRLFSLLGFDYEDSRRFLRRFHSLDRGHGNDTSGEAMEILRVMGLSRERSALLGGYSITLELFNLGELFDLGKGRGDRCLEDIISSLSLSEAGRGNLYEIVKAYEPNFEKRYGSYFRAEMVGV